MKSHIRAINCLKLGNLTVNGRGQNSRVCGLILAMRIMVTKAGKRMGILTLDDKSARMDVTIFADLLDQHEALLTVDNIIVLQGQVSEDYFNGGLKMNAREIMSIDQARERFASKLRLNISSNILQLQTIEQFQGRLKEVLTPAAGGLCPVFINYQNHQAQVEIELGIEWSITPSDDLLFELERLLGENNVTLYFDQG